MIKANELRSGNIFSHNGKPFKVDGFVDVEFFGVQVLSGKQEIEIKDVEPIPITPEWLEKCGFEKVGSAYHLSNTFIYLPGGPRMPFGFGIKGAGLITSIRYLHQLQNLYYALTGEELEMR